MSGLVTQRCHHHAGREAVARCPACARFFCRECVTEHDGRIICAGCLAAAGAEAAPAPRHRGWLIFWRMVQFGLMGVFTWFFFYALGSLLLRMPSSFHEGTLWEMSEPNPKNPAGPATGGRTDE